MLRGFALNKQIQTVQTWLLLLQLIQYNSVTSRQNWSLKCSANWEPLGPQYKNFYRTDSVQAAKPTMPKPVPNYFHTSRCSTGIFKLQLFAKNHRSMQAYKVCLIHRKDINNISFLLHIRPNECYIVTYKHHSSTINNCKW